MKRKPAVAGTFYSARQQDLKDQVASLMPEGVERKRIVGAMSPHAGLVYSGGVAGLVYSGMEPPGCFLLLGPNHTGMGAKVALMAEGSWELPTGTLEIDSSLAESIASRSPDVTRDESAHMFEHSLEVQLPFIIQAAPEASIVPIAIMSASLAELIGLGKDLASAVREHSTSVVIVASTDMSHFIPEKQARELDQHALDRVLALDPEGLYHTVLQEGITMCGFMPTVAMLSAARELGATSAELMRYTTSAEVSRDYDSVVGYAGVLIS